MTNPLVDAYAAFWPTLLQTRLAALSDALREATLARAAEPSHGAAQRWFTALAALPRIDCTAHLDVAAVRAVANAPLTIAQRRQIESALRGLEPWRKGPFELAGVTIDAEWRSDWKWQRIAAHLRGIEGATVLDVGAGNGYYALRMIGQGAAVVLGIDPSLLYCAQMAAALHFLTPGIVSPPVPAPHARAPLATQVLPLRLQDMPAAQPCFDTVLSMGVLYHQRSPIEHLQQLGAWLQPGGQLVLETLIVTGDVNTVLVPEDRYARMRNVWFVPSVAALTVWLRRSGFVDVRCVDICATTVNEQRSTAWMSFESLREALDSHDPARTVEGLPAPVRAVMTATRPGK